jgi:hypothetical protein
MSLRGSLRTMPIEDLLDWIDRRFACGSLTLEQGPASCSFHFDSGYVTNASSNDAAEHLGQLLRRRGLVAPEALEDAFRVQADTGVLLGKILLMVGAIDEAALRQTLEAKILEAVADVVAWAEGTFVFEPDAATDTVSEYEVSVNLRTAIDVGRERVERWRAIRAAIENDSVRFWLKDAAAVAAADPGLADGLAAGHSVAEIALTVARTRFELLDALAKLLAAGAIALDKRHAPRVAETDMSLSQLVQAVRGRADGGDRAGALEMAERALARNADDALLQQLRVDMERMVFAELSRTLLASFRVPKLLKSKQELDSIDMNQAERYLTGRIDGRWDLLSLMRISPMREVEALLAFKRLSDRGIISL